MKITAEFNSTQELVNFIGAFGMVGAKSSLSKTSPVQDKKLYESIAKFQDKPAEAPIKEAELNKEEIKTEEPLKEEETKTEEPKEEVKVTKEMVRERLGAIMKAGKQAEVKALVAKHGAGKLPDLKEDDYAAVYKEAEVLL